MGFGLRGQELWCGRCDPDLSKNSRYLVVLEKLSDGRQDMKRKCFKPAKR